MSSPYPLRLDAVNRMPAAAFVERFGDVAEHSPWVAERAAGVRPFASREAMVAAFADALMRAPRTDQLALLHAHPDLAGRAAITGSLAAESKREQARVGLDALTPEEFRSFSDLNARYRERFGFPFIFAVKGATKSRILAAFAERIDNDPAAELATALAQVCRIFRFRIEGRVLP